MMLINGETVLDTYNKKTLARIPDADKQMLVGTETGILIIGGTNSFSALQSGLSTLADHVFLRNGSVPLEATTIIRGDKSIIVFDPESKLQVNGLSSDIFSWQHSVAKSHVYKFFNAATHPNANTIKNFGDIVEHYPGGATQLTQSLPNKDLYTTTKGILILASDSSNTLPTLSKTTTLDAAVQLYKLGYYGDSSSPYFIKNRVILQPSETSLSFAFESYLKATSSQVYVINTSRAGNSLNTLIDAVARGSVESATTSVPLSGIKLEAITRVDGVPANVLEPQGKQKPADYATATKLLGAKLGIASL